MERVHQLVVAVFAAAVVGEPVFRAVVAQFLRDGLVDVARGLSFKRAEVVFAQVVQRDGRDVRLAGVLQDDLRGGGGARAGAAIGGSKADLGLGDGVACLRGACFAFGGERGIAPALHDAGGVVFGLPVADEIEIERGGHRVLFWLGLFNGVSGCLGMFGAA